MPTRKDKTNVAPIYREQVFIPASGATLTKQKARPKIAGRPISSGAIEIVSPEFDLLTGIRGIATLKNLPINITSKNAHKIKDKTWDKLYNAAIDKGDVEEIKRLRDLHFQAKSRNNFIINEDGTPKHLYHATKNKFNSFDLNKAGTGSGNLSNTEGVVYFSPYKEASLDVFRPKKSEVKDFNIMDLYVNNTNPVNVRLSDFIKTWNNKEEFLKLRNAGEGIIAKGIKTPQQYYDEAVKKYLEKEKSGTLSVFDRKPESIKEFMEEQLVDNYTINNPNNIKSAKAITYDNNGNLIPLSKRDNFNINDIRMKCGGRRKAQLGLDIREGGIAIPIANNMFYINGRKHAAGGVAIGPNNKNGVEVEGGEVVEMIDSNHPSVGRQFKAGGQQQTMRVFSSVPFLRGASPAELVLGGANPDAVFKAQEEFKDRNRINDDGTTYEMGGEGKAKSKRSRPVTGVLPYGYTIRNLYAVENPYRKGIKGNVAKMYDNRTLGAGVDVVSGHPELYKKAKSGRITKKQADETAVIHLRKDDNAIRNNYADVYGKAAADTLSYGPRFLVAQARYQQGNVRKAWKPIHKAMAKGDAKALKKAVLQVTPKDHEYRRKWIEGFKVYKMGGMIYTINGNVKNGLSLRTKAKYRLATKYLKKKDNDNVNKDNKKTSNSKKVNYNFNDGAKIALGTVGGLGVAGVTSYGLTKLENYLNEVTKPSLEISQKALDKYNENYIRKTQGKTNKGFTPRNPLKGSNNIQYRRLDINEHNIGLYDSKDPIVRATIKARGLNPNRVTANGSFVRQTSNLSKAEQRNLDKVYRKAVGNKEPKSGFEIKPADKVVTAEYPNTSIDSKPTNVVGKTYDPTVEFRQAVKPKPAPNTSLTHYLKKIGKGVRGLGVIGSIFDIYNNLFPSEEVEALENLRVKMKKTNKDLTKRRQTKYGGRIKAEGGKFLKYKNGVFTDPETGEQFDVDPEVFKMYGNTKESGVIPISDYTKGTFNARPQYYAEKRLPIAGSQSMAEKAGLARSGWSYGENPTFDYAPNINISVPTNYAKAVGDNTKKSTSSTPRGEGTTSASSASSRGTAKVESPKPATPTNPNEARYASRVQKGQAQEVIPKPVVEYNEAADKNPDKYRYTRSAGFKAGKSPSSTGGGTQSKDERLIPQFKPINTGDWIGLSSNLAGHIASYFINNNLLNKYPMPTKPALFQADKLKTTHNINPKLATSRETEQMNLAEVGRNTSSSSTSIARKQRIMNEARDARNKLYGEKENIETQLINLDKRNRQDVFNRNIAAFNDWLDKTYIAKTNKLLEKQKNMMSLINGIPSAVNHTLGVIETRRNANNAYKAIAAANPNVDGRLLGIGDYYVGEKTKKKYDKFGNLIS